MAQTKDVQTDYLTNIRSIEETLLRMYYAVDSNQYEMLTERVFAREITTDYSLLFGWQPKTRTAAEQTENWRETMQNMELTQHLITGFLPIYDDSTAKSAIFDTETVTMYANVQARLRKNTLEGRTVETLNAGRAEFVMVKQPGPPHAWPEWRLRSLKAFGGFDVGGKEFWSAS